MTSVYARHEAAFSRVSAFVILLDRQIIARVALKFPQDGAGRLTCYFHVLGTEMVTGSASGYGYDKRSASVEAAACKIEAGYVDALKTALSSCGGHDWTRVVEKAGYTVIQAV